MSPNLVGRLLSSKDISVEPRNLLCGGILGVLLALGVDHSVSANGVDANETRHSVPNENRQKQSLQKIKTVFAAEFSAATTSDGKLALAKTLHVASKTIQTDVVANFVLLRLAYENSRDGGDFRQAEQIASEICSVFSVDLLTLRFDLLNRVSGTVRKTDDRVNLAGFALQLANDLAAKRRFNEATRAATIAEALATRGRTAELIEEANLLSRRIRVDHQDWTAAEQARETLIASVCKKMPSVAFSAGWEQFRRPRR